MIREYGGKLKKTEKEEKYRDVVRPLSFLSFRKYIFKKDGEAGDDVIQADRRHTYECFRSCGGGGGVPLSTCVVLRKGEGVEGVSAVQLSV